MVSLHVICHFRNQHEKGFGCEHGGDYSLVIQGCSYITSTPPTPQAQQPQVGDMGLLEQTLDPRAHVHLHLQEDLIA
jgi:hypothetical protein